MTLFKTQTFWCTTCQSGIPEEYNQNSLIILNLQDCQQDCVALGSHNGILRVFQPHCTLSQDERNFIGHRPTDLLLEYDLGQPILQLGKGRLVSGSTNDYLAVLHPHQFSVYNLYQRKTNGQSVENDLLLENGQFVFQMVYTHKLQWSCFCFVVGPFGGVENRDFVLCQSLCDGKVQFFEQEVRTFSTYFPHTLLAQPICFLNGKFDVFLTCNSNWYLTCFRYRSLVNASNIGPKTEQEPLPEWSVSLGEGIMDLQCLQYQLNIFILVLGEKTLFCFNEKGLLLYMKTFDYSPICFTTYFIDEKPMALVVSDTKTLNFYHQTTLKWSSRIDFPAICVKIGNFPTNLKSAIILLSPNGFLQCCYLGTNPDCIDIGRTRNTDDFDVDRITKELDQLNTTIGRFSNQGNRPEKPLEIHIEADKENVQCIKIEITPQIALDELQIVIESKDDRIQWEPAIHFFENCEENGKITISTGFTQNPDVFSLEYGIFITFLTIYDQPGCWEYSTELYVEYPLENLMEIGVPSKEATHKVTLELINRDFVLPNLHEIFPEFSKEESAVVALQSRKSPDNSTVTIISGKSTKRLRLQTDCFPYLGLYVEMVCQRLRKLYTGEDGVLKFTVTVLPHLYGLDTIDIIRDHYGKWLKFTKLQDELSEFSGQLRLIQRGLIGKLKSASDSNLLSIENVLNFTIGEIMEIGDQLVAVETDLRQLENRLNSHLHTIGRLIVLVPNVPNECHDLFSGKINNNCPGQDWESVTDGILNFLLRTILAKRTTDQQNNDDKGASLMNGGGSRNFEELKDFEKFSRHFQTVLERVLKYKISTNLEDSTTETEEADERFNAFENLKMRCLSAVVPLGKDTLN